MPVTLGKKEPTESLCSANAYQQGELHAYWAANSPAKRNYELPGEYRGLCKLYIMPCL